MPQCLEDSLESQGIEGLAGRQVRLVIHQHGRSCTFGVYAIEVGINNLEKPEVSMKFDESVTTKRSELYHRFQKSKHK